jgi:hypothetical protein
MLELGGYFRGDGFFVGLLGNFFGLGGSLIFCEVQFVLNLGLALDQKMIAFLLLKRGTDFCFEFVRAFL